MRLKHGRHKVPPDKTFNVFKQRFKFSFWLLTAVEFTAGAVF